MNQVLLRMKNIRKTFPGVLALDNIDFELESGEIHGMLGENGAGKSTLINVLGGIYIPDRGEIIINGQKTQINGVKDAQEAGIAVIHQELVLVPHMSIAENVFLGREIKSPAGLVDKKRMERESVEILKRVGLEISPSVPVRSLSVAQQQMVEIAKALSLNARILVMDEPSSSLTDSEVERMFTIMRKLKREGVGIIYISHKMKELFEITDRITVIRDGSYIGTIQTSEADMDQLVHMMVGRELTSYYTLTEHEIGNVMLELKDINRSGVLKNIDFSVRAGEIVGFAGLVGAGRSELFKAVLGIEPMDSGTVLIEGKNAGRLSPKKAQEMGMVLVPENRKKEGLVLINTVAFNLTLPVLDQFVKGIFVNKKRQLEIENTYIDSMNIKTPSRLQKVGNLSGGNQQKVVIGKWLAARPKILILDEPTRGVDVGAKAEIYKIIDRLAEQGIAIVIISSEMAELINMCDRMVVMNQGRIAGELKKSEMGFSQESIMRLATGGGAL